MKINQYPDGTSYVEVEDQSQWHEIVHRINSYEDLWHLNQFVDAHNSVYLNKPSIHIPCLLDAQADRRFDYNQSSGLRLVLEFLKGMKASFTIFHPHNSEVVEAILPDAYIQDNEDFIEQVLDHIDTTNLTLMAPDAGAFKPLVRLANSLKWGGTIYSALKARDPKTGELTQEITRQDFEGKDILIVDDICIYGGTAKGLAKMLRERNCGKLYFAASHMTIQNLGSDPVTNYFDKVFTTNSKYDEYYYGDISEEPITELQIIKMFEI